MHYTEQDRINTVNKYIKLDAGIENDLDEIVELISEICGTPVALITLLDDTTQWFKAAIGTDVKCTDREVSFCNGTIKQDQVLIIPDLLLDKQHCNNPLVINEPHVRFYAGAPLITKEGHAIGSLCVVDMLPRNINEKQKKSLKTLARQVVNLMELNWSLTTLDEKHKKEQEHALTISESELKLKAVFDSTEDTHILINKECEIIAFNRSAEVFIYNNYRQQIREGDSIFDYTEPAMLRQFKKYINIAFTGRAIKREWQLMAGTALECWKITSFIPVKNNDGEVIGVSLNSADVTHRKKQEEYIKIQNAALQRIAIIQSHELRRPVASLLGIMDLLRMEKINFSYFDMMEVTVNELDRKIRGIVKDSEDTLHRNHLSIVA
ncbi:GAF domain-containing protein [Mucilaginibacter segetis]|uniref:GAF domain-containing protein n=1 Tax=Mucilaginibacter segetis TaxID=2793071 RepID=A0A934PS80_9SPHI|nr:GAF domain-containing protein [Mucilaginibacter segetis]MBK0378661.1 GAF domain-containing protein [Mucilaginibacter segetis]